MTGEPAPASGAPTEDVVRSRDPLALRREDLESRFPGLLDAVLRSAPSGEAVAALGAAAAARA